MKNRVSIVLCAYNEEDTVEEVISKCYEFNKESDIVVVDDGSIDGTQGILLALNDKIPFNYIRLQENQGKSHAMVVGVENAKNEVILFWDADVSGIQKEHFDQMIEPLFSNEKEADMVLGQPSETLIDYRLNPFKGLTGERAIFKKDLDPILEEIRDIRFGVETYINLYFQAHGKKIKYIILDGLMHPTKYGKTTPLKATAEFLSEGQEIAQTLIKNHDLILKRIEYSFSTKNEEFKQKMTILQNDINDKIRSIFQS